MLQTLNIFLPQNTIIFNTKAGRAGKMLQTLKRPGGRVQVSSGIKNVKPTDDDNDFSFFPRKLLLFLILQKCYKR